MYIIVNSGVADDGETFAQVVGSLMSDYEEGKKEFHKFIVESYLNGEDVPVDHIIEEEGLYVDLQTCLYTESSDSYTHIELLEVK